MLTGIDGNDAFEVHRCHHAAAKAVKADLCVGYEEHFEEAVRSLKSREFISVTAQLSARLAGMTVKILTRICA